MKNKECPFCGAIPEEDDTASGTYQNRLFISVVCPNCEAYGPSVYSSGEIGEERRLDEERAFAAWNKRGFYKRLTGSTDIGFRCVDI